MSVVAQMAATRTGLQVTMMLSNGHIRNKQEGHLYVFLNDFSDIGPQLNVPREGT